MSTKPSNRLPTTEAFAEVHLDEGEARRIMHALDIARDAVCCITKSQAAVHQVPLNIADILEEAMDILGPKLGMPKDRV